MISAAKSVSVPVGMEQSRLDASVFLRCPEIEIVARRELWINFIKDESIFIRANFPMHRLKAPYQWNENPLKNPSWLLFFHSLYYVGTLYHGVVTFADSDDQRLFAVSHLKNLIFSYFDFLTSQAVESHVSAWDDHSAAYRASYLCLVYANVLEPVLNSQEKECYVCILKLHIEVLVRYIESGKWKNSNHTIFQLEGLMDLALTVYGRSGEGKKIIEKCKAAFTTYITSSVSIVDGTTREHAHFYHPFLMERIRAHHQYLLVNGIDVQLDILQVLRKMNRFMWLSMPEKGLVLPIGDTKYAMYVNKKYYQEFLTEPYMDDEIRYLVSEGRYGQRPAFFNQFREDGYYLFRDTSDFKKGLFSTFLEKRVIGPHGHVDGGTFVAYLGALPIFVDSGGPYQYKASLRHSYFQTQLAHNSLIIQAPTRHLSEVVTSISGSNFAFLASRADLSPGNTWYRVFGQIASSIIVVVDLAVCEDTSSPVQLRYHLAPEARFVECDDGVRIINIDGNKVYLYFQDAEALRPAVDRDPTSPRHSRKFDAKVFPLEEQTISLITRNDGESEPGNMICRSVEPYRPVCMLVGIGQRPVAIMSNRVDGLELYFPPIPSVWPGGCLAIEWDLNETSNDCVLSFEPSA